jgi:hypothetical protein
MGQHKYNPTAQAAARGELPPKRPTWAQDELYRAMPAYLRRKVALLTGAMAAITVAADNYNQH